MTGTTSKRKKIQWIVFVIFLLVIGFFYSLRPLTIHVFGEQYFGVVTDMEHSAALKGGNPKSVKYVRNDHVYTQTTNAYQVRIGDGFHVYYKKYFFGSFDFVGDQVMETADSVLVFSENVPSDVKEVQIYEYARFVKTVDVHEIKNFGAWVKRRMLITIKYDDAVHDVFTVLNPTVVFREIQ